MKKRLLSWFLTLSMLLALLPIASISAYAEDHADYTALTSSRVSSDGGYVALIGNTGIANYYLSEDIQVNYLSFTNYGYGSNEEEFAYNNGKVWNLCLHGNTLSHSASGFTGTIRMLSGATVNIYNDISGACLSGTTNAGVIDADPNSNLNINDAGIKITGRFGIQLNEGCSFTMPENIEFSTTWGDFWLRGDNTTRAKIELTTAISLIDNHKYSVSLASGAAWESPEIVTQGWSTYMSGKNPADYFTEYYGRPVILYSDGTDDEVAFVNFEDSNLRTVTFNMNGHGTAPTKQTVYTGYKAYEPTVPTAEGYTFGGWYKDADCTTAWDFGSDTVTQNTTLYAKWIEPHICSGGIAGGPDITFATGITTEDELKALFTNGGSGYLTQDLTLSATAEVASGKEVYLCLNDHTITTAAEVNGSILRVGYSTLLLSDCGSTVRYFTDSNEDGAFESIHDSLYDISGQTLGTDYIKTEGGVLYGGRTASSGGAIDTSGSATLTIKGINLVGNRAQQGGAVYSASELTVKNCLIEGNCSDTNGGAIMCANISVTDSKLSYNTAHLEGGAVYSNEISDIVISGTELIGNRVLNSDASDSTAAGGALSVYHKAATLKDCVVRDNVVDSQYGTAQFAALVSSALTLLNTTVSNNTAKGKKAFAVIQSGKTEIENSTISENNLIGETSAECLIYFMNGDSIIKNSRITDNTAVCSGDGAKNAGLKAAILGTATLELSGDLVFSGNTLCDINTIEQLRLSSLTSVKDADNQTSSIAYYYSRNNGYLIADESIIVSTVTDQVFSSWFTSVNPEAYIINKEVEGGNQVYLVSRVLEQPTVENDCTFTIYTDDLTESDISYRWYKRNGNYLTEEDEAITLGTGCTWDGSTVQGCFSRLGVIVSFTTNEPYLYVYDAAGYYYGAMTGTAEPVAGCPGVYKVIPDNHQVTLKMSGIRLSKALVTDDPVDGNTSAALTTRSKGAFRCIATIKSVDILSSYVTLDHIHAWSYAADGASITATCTADNHGGSTTETLTLVKPAHELYNDGEDAEVTFLQPETMLGGASVDADDVVYYQNATELGTIAPTAAGTYQAKFTVEGATAVLEYTIAKAEQAAPTTVVAVNETIKGKADGKLTGLTDNMEYYRPGEATATAVTGSGVADLPSGTYEVRYKATGDYAASDAQTVTIGFDKALTVTFNSMGGSAVAPVTGISYNGTVSRPVDPVRDESTFSGWYLNGTAYDFANKITENITLEAYWILNKADAETTIADDGITTTKIQVIGDTGVKASGLEVVAATVKQNGNTDNNVKVVLTAEKTTETAENAEEVHAIKALAGSSKTVELLAIDLTKYINSNNSEKITNTGGKVIEVLIPYATTGKQDITVYRYHEGEGAVAFSNIQPGTDGADGTFYVENDVLHLFTTKFSTYAIGYTTQNPGGNSSGGSSDIAVNINQTKPVNVACFVDVHTTDYFASAVGWAVNKGITMGKDSTHFNPLDITTRAEMVTFLWRASGSPEPKTTVCPFTDVPETAYYYKAVLWGYENVFVKGTSATTFTPDATVTRGQAVTFLARMAGVADEADGYSHSFTDVSKDTYYNNAIAWASANGITTGITQTTFAPDLGCKRGQAVTFLYRYFVK